MLHISCQSHVRFDQTRRVHLVAVSEFRMRYFRVSSSALGITSLPLLDSVNSSVIMDTDSLSEGSSSRNTSIYHLTHEIHQTVTRSIDTALSWDQLNSPSVNYTLVRPIVDRYAGQPSSSEKQESRRQDQLRPDSESAPWTRNVERGDVKLGSVLYALMANRSVAL